MLLHYCKLRSVTELKLYPYVVTLYDHTQAKWLYTREKYPPNTASYYVTYLMPRGSTRHSEEVSDI